MTENDIKTFENKYKLYRDLEIENEKCINMLNSDFLNDNDWERTKKITDRICEALKNIIKENKNKMKEI
jgi:hypothetical protein